MCGFASVGVTLTLQPGSLSHFSRGHSHTSVEVTITLRSKSLSDKIIYHLGQRTVPTKCLDSFFSRASCSRLFSAIENGPLPFFAKKNNLFSWRFNNLGVVDDPISMYLHPSLPLSRGFAFVSLAGICHGRTAVKIVPGADRFCWKWVLLCLLSIHLLLAG